MPPASKRLKITSETTAATTSSSAVNDELQSLQNEINKIKETSLETAEPIEDNDYTVNRQIEQSFVLYDESMVVNKNPEVKLENQFEDFKKFMRDQIRMSERRIQNRCDIIEGKLNRLLDRQTTVLSGGEEEYLEEDHIYEVVEEGSVQPTFHQSVEVTEQDFKIFPIFDESTFDYFFEKLKSEEYRDLLIERRWKLSKAVNMKSLKIAVKEFLLMHFDLSVCIKYSVSGFGAHGIRKKKLDSNSLTIFVFECFNRSCPGQHIFTEISKAIVQFWGRSPEYFNRAAEKIAKLEINQDNKMKNFN